MKTRMDAPAPARQRLVLVSGDPQLAELVRPVAAAAGMRLHVVVSPPRGPGNVVLVDAARLPDSATRLGPAIAVAREQPSDALWRSLFQSGVTSLAVLPQDGPRLLELIAAAGSTPSARRGVVVAVLGAAGGIGASTFATVLAGHGGPALLIDLDPVGPGLDLLLGLERAEGLRWPELSEVDGPLPVNRLAGQLPAVKDCELVCFESALGSEGQSRPPVRPVPAAVAGVVATAREHYPLVVIDCGRSPGEVVDLADRIVLICGDRVADAGAAKRYLAALGIAGDPRLKLLVRPLPGGVGSDRLARFLQLEAAGRLPRDRAVRADQDAGLLPPARRRLVRRARRVRAGLLSADGVR